MDIRSPDLHILCALISDIDRELLFPMPPLEDYTGVLAWIPLGALCLWIVLSGQLKAEPAPSLPEVGVDSQ